LREPAPSPPAGEPEGDPAVPLSSSNALTGRPNLKPVPIFKWGLTFSGEASDNLISFLERVNELSIARGTNEADLFASAIDLLTGPALIWYRSIRDTLFDWTSLVIVLKAEFLPDDYDELLWSHIKQRSQHEDEPIAIYLAVMHTLFNRLAETPFEAVRVKWLRKLIRLAFVSALVLQEITSVSQLRKLCKKVEVTLPVSEQKRAQAVVETALSSPMGAKAKTSGPSMVSNPSSFVRTREPHVKSPPITTLIQSLSSNPQKDNSFRAKPDPVTAVSPNARKRYCYQCGNVGFTKLTCPTCRSKNE
jgi:hypothetical protein